MIELYFWPTGNGKKVVILLEEAGIPYEIKPVNIGRGDQFEADFLKIAPNNRMPAIVDTDPIGGGAPLSIFESGAIMMYLAEKAGKFWPQEPHKKYEVAQWCYWQTGNQGPKMGEQGNFARAAQDPKNGDLHYAMKRFGDEVHRLYGVMNLGLHGKQHLAAGEYTIADMICYPWSVNWKMRGIDLDEFPNVKRWLEMMEARPPCRRRWRWGRSSARTRRRSATRRRRAAPASSPTSARRRCRKRGPRRPPNEGTGGRRRAAAGRRPRRAGPGGRPGGARAGDQRARRQPLRLSRHRQARRLRRRALLDGKLFASLPQHSYTSIAVRPGHARPGVPLGDGCGHGDVTDQLQIADRRLYYFALTGDAQLTRDPLGRLRHQPPRNHHPHPGRPGRGRAGGGGLLPLREGERAVLSRHEWDSYCAPRSAGPTTSSDGGPGVKANIIV